jgi:FHA domain
VRSRTLATSESQGHQGQHQPHAQQGSGSARRGAGGQGGYGYPPQPASPPPMPANPPGYAPVTRLPGTADPSATTRRWIEINGNRHQISRSTLVLGRSTEADVRIDDPGVSRRHCEIRAGSPSMVQDLGSTNGIVVDGQHTQRATLRDGSRIVVGSTTIVYRQAEG